jgi:hypothetical protein
MLQDVCLRFGGGYEKGCTCPHVPGTFARAVWSAMLLAHIAGDSGHQWNNCILLGAILSVGRQEELFRKTYHTPAVRGWRASLCFGISHA